VSALLQWILVLVVAYFAFRWAGWPAAAGVIVLYLIGSYLYRKSREHSDRVTGALIVSMPLSDSEKIHMESMQERNQRLAQRQSGKR
jgi:hypothetical protein